MKTPSSFILPFPTTPTSSFVPNKSVCLQCARVSIQPKYGRRAMRRVMTPRAEMVNVTVGLKIEAPTEHCYELFSDLSLMSEWSSTIAGKRDLEDPSFSKWNFSWSGVSLSWRAKDMAPENENNGNEYVIRWRSVSGLPHTGCVSFHTDENDGDTSSAKSIPSSIKPTMIQFSVDYDVTSLVAFVTQSSFFSSFIKRAVLYDLQRFRSYALRKYRARQVKQSTPTNAKNS